ncbi:MAG: class IV adenylate cyclase [Lachnospiraceae bacterium]|nr:class IV adenylate cyclase [Lachnospiraceae bacterium]
MLEIEVKLRIESSIAIKHLTALGFNKECTVYEKDTYFNGEYIDLKKEDKALRIRIHRNIETGNTNFTLNFKGPKIDNVSMSREETEFEVPSYEQANSFLCGLGFHPAGEVEKNRTTYKKEDITCCIDNVTGLGEFLEIEIIAPEDKYEESMKRIEDILSSMELSINNTIRESYLCMLS